MCVYIYLSVSGVSVCPLSVYPSIMTTPALFVCVREYILVIFCAREHILVRKHCLPGYHGNTCSLSLYLLCSRIHLTRCSLSVYCLSLSTYVHMYTRMTRLPPPAHMHLATPIPPTCAPPPNDSLTDHPPTFPSQPPGAVALPPRPTQRPESHLSCGGGYGGLGVWRFVGQGFCQLSDPQYLVYGIVYGIWYTRMYSVQVRGSRFLSLPDTQL